MHRLRSKSMREEEMDYSNLFVVLMGLGTVFAGLLFREYHLLQSSH